MDGIRQLKQNNLFELNSNFFKIQNSNKKITLFLEISEYISEFKTIDKHKRYPVKRKAKICI